MENQLLVTRSRCTGCGRCAKYCPAGAIRIRDGKAVTDRSICTVCGACVDVCMEEIREVCGQEYTIEELMRYALADKLFYEGSGGGITVSGGEPLVQAEFVSEFLKQCKASGIHTALDTTGFAPWEKMEKVVQYTDLVLFDIKHMDSKMHKELTGVPNEQILANLKRLASMNVEIYIRIPTIPGMNDSDENIRATARFVKNELGGGYKTFLLPYHHMGESKLESLEEKEGYLELQSPTDEHMQRRKAIFEELGLECQIGG